MKNGLVVNLVTKGAKIRVKTEIKNMGIEIIKGMPKVGPVERIVKSFLMRTKFKKHVKYNDRKMVRVFDPIVIGLNRIITGPQVKI